MNNCNHCNKKINLYYLKCKCNNLYCYKCINNDVHNCSYDYKNEYKKILEKNNKKIIHSKIDHI